MDRQADVRISNRPDLSYGRGNTDGISISESFQDTDIQEQSKPIELRDEMSGPTDINELLSGIKNKKEDDSINLNIGEKQQKSKRKNRSNKNTISLNI